MLKTPVLIGSFLFVLVVTFVAAILILIVSHKTRPQTWTVQPSVALSFLASVYSITLGGLFLLGLAIIWWRGLRHGTTLKRLHYTFMGASPVNFWPAFRVGGTARRVAVAAVIVFFARVAVGPMLQRATKVRERGVERDVAMGVGMVQQMPDGWYGTWDDYDFPGINIVRDTVLNNTITISGPEKRTQVMEDAGIESLVCVGNGTCSGVVRGAGLNYALTTDTRRMDLKDKENIGETVFRIWFEVTYLDDDVPMLHFEAEYVNHVDENCVATVTTDSVYLVPATVPYPMAISSGTTLTLDTARLISSLLDPATEVQNYNSTGDELQPEGSSAPMGPLLGTFHGIGPVYQSKALLSRENNKIGFKITEEPLYSPYWPTIFVVGDAKVVYPDICPIVFSSPTQKILSSLMEFAFRSAFAAAGNSVSNSTSDDKFGEVLEDEAETSPNLQAFTARFTGTELHHITDFDYLAASAIVMVTGIAAALSLVWGFWQLDRFVTLSPLETGKALGAPILEKSGPYVLEADAILDAVGAERVAHDGKELIWSETVYGSRPVRMTPSHDANTNGGTLQPSMEMSSNVGLQIIDPGSGIAGHRNTRADSLTLGLHIPAPTPAPTLRHSTYSPTSPISPTSHSSFSVSHSGGDVANSKRWGTHYDSSSTLIRFPSATSQTQLVSGRSSVDSNGPPSPIPLCLVPGRGGVPELPPLPMSLQVGKGKVRKEERGRFYASGTTVTTVSKVKWKKEGSMTEGSGSGSGTGGVKRHASAFERISRLVP